MLKRYNVVEDVSDIKIPIDKRCRQTGNFCQMRSKTYIQCYKSTLRLLVT